MTVLQNPLLRIPEAVAGGGGGSGYQIEKSLRFSEDDDANLIRGFGSGNRRTWTLNFWYKRTLTGAQGSSDYIFGCGPDANNTLYLYMTSVTLRLYNAEAGTNNVSMVTNQVFRDPAAWQMITLAVDTTQSVESDRIKIYVNGEQVTSWAGATYPAQDAELQVNKNVNHFWGRIHDTSTDPLLDGYLADIQFIDGLQLSAAAFGEFDSSTNVWNPKAFALPAPNDGTTWSDQVSGSFHSSDFNETKAFDGNASSTWAIPAAATNVTWTPTSTITATSSIRVHFDKNGTGGPFKQNGNDIRHLVADGWVELPERTITELIWGSDSANNQAQLMAVEVDGVILVDGKTDPTTRNNPNTGTKWSDGTITGGAYGGNAGNSWPVGFQGSLGNNSGNEVEASGNDPAYKLVLAKSVPFSHGVSVYIRSDSDSPNSTFKVNNVDQTGNIPTGTSLSTGVVKVNCTGISSPLTSVEIGLTSGSTFVGLQGIEVDGHILRDEIVDNSFHLKFNDTSGQSALGYSSLPLDVNNPDTGGPILKTTATSSGKTLDSGYNTDSNASSLVLAIPGNAAVDESNHINNSSSEKTITYTAGAVAKTDQSRYYGTSTYCTGGARIVSSQTNDCRFSGEFTIEGWFRLADGTANNTVILWSGGTGSGRYLLWTDSNKLTLVVYDSNTPTQRFQGSTGISTDAWHHFAICRDSSDLVSGYLDGQLEGTWDSSSYGSDIGGDADSTAPEIGSQSGGNNCTGWFQDFRFYSTCKYTDPFDPQAPKDFTVNNINPDDGGIVVGSATGGKPIRQTTDDPNYGQTAHASNLNADSNSDELVLAIPFFADMPGAGSLSGSALYSGSFENVFKPTETTAPAYTSSASSKWTLTTPLPVTGTVRVKVSHGSSGTTSNKDLLVIGYNDGSTTTIDCGVYAWASKNWVELSGSGSWNTIEYFDLQYSSGGQGAALWRVEMDGTELVNKPVQDVSHTIRGSGSEKALTFGSSNAVANADNSRYYGTCMNFNASAANTENVVADAASADFTFGTGTFTIEWWYRWNAAIDNNTGDSFFNQGVTASGNLNLYMAGKDNLTVRWGGNPDYNFCDTSDLVTAGKTWHHFALVREGTGSNQTHFFLDGDLKESFTMAGNITSTAFNIGNYSGQTSYFNKGRMQDYRVYKGVAKYTSSFTVPVAPVPTDIDSFPDSPTNYGTDDGNGGEVRGNYCTWNPIGLFKDLQNAPVAFTQGNLHVSNTGKYSVPGTLSVSSGKWYCEYDINAGSEHATFGLCRALATGDNYERIGWYNNGGGSGTIVQDADNPGSNQTPSNTWTSGVFGVQLDLDSSPATVKWYINGSLDTTTNLHTNNLIGTNRFTPMMASHGSTDTVTCTLNTGQRPWKYPSQGSGHKAWCTQNLDDTFSGDELNNPSKYFDVLGYTSTATDGTEISGLGFQPDLVWIKNRETANHLAVFDVTRGANKILRASGSNAEYSGSDTFQSFDSGGFTLDEDAGFNATNYPSGDAHVAWCWDAGTAAATASTQGSVTPGEQWVNTTAGFSITKWTVPSSGTDYTVGHGLSAKPDLMILKNATSAHNWDVYHSGIGAEYRFKLNDKSHKEDYTGPWNDVEPNSTVFTTTKGWQNAGDTMVAYIWNEIPGYSSFGTYEGKSAANFIHTGFQPRWILIKRALANSASDTSASFTSWGIWDTKRKAFNGLTGQALWANSDPAAEGTRGDTTSTTNLDDMELSILSNGFSLDDAGSENNADTSDYIYAAFAEHPFKIARAH